MPYILSIRIVFKYWPHFYMKDVQFNTYKTLFNIQQELRSIFVAIL